MRLSVFNGGLHTKPAEHFIEANESVECVNVDLDKGILTPVRSYDDTIGPVTNVDKYGYYYSPTDTWYTSPTPADWLEFQGSLYFSDRINPPVVYFGEDTQELGITAPTVDDISLTLSALGPTPDSVNLPDIFKFAIHFNVAEFEGTGLQTNKTYTYRLAKVEVIDSVSYRVYSGTDSYYLSEAEASGGLPNYGVDVHVNVNAPSGVTVELYRQYLDTYYRVGSIVTDGSTEEKFEDITAIDSSTALKLQEFLFGIYEYAITFENTTTNEESAAYFVPGEIEVDNQNISIEGTIAVPDTSVDRINLYRTGGGISTYTRHTSFNLADLTETSPGIYEISLTDDIKNVDLPGPQLDTSTGSQTVNKPKRLRYLVESYAVFFAVADYTPSGFTYPNRLYFTPINDPNRWPVLNFLTFPIDITGVAVVANGILVFTIEKTYLVTGVTPEDFNQITLSSSQGCISHESIALVNDTAIWVSREGICISNGSNVEVITRSKLNRISFDPVNAVIYNNNYYLQLTDDTIFEADLQSGKYKYISISTASVLVGNNNLYGFVEASNTYYILFSSSSIPTPLTYKSPKFIGESYVASKLYNYVYITSEGTLTIEVYIDDTLVATYDLEGAIKNHEVKIPHKYTRGYAIQFKITGTGTVYEIYVNEGSPNR